MRLLVLLLVMVGAASAQPEGLRKISYSNFTLWMDCERRGVTMFQYVLGPDRGDTKRARKFHLDKNHLDCQQTSTSTYRRDRQGMNFPSNATYDRGHMVPANHFDGSKESVTETNVMTNVLPQVSIMNRGAWYETEELAECHRQAAPVYVLGGVIWGDNPEDDYFLESHGVPTPDAFWKVLYTEPEGVIAWVMPNNAAPTRSRVGDYIVTLQELQEKTGVAVQMPEGARVATQMWEVSPFCDRS